MNDYVLLIDIFSMTFDLLSNVSATFHDINQDIAKHYGIPERETFDKPKDEIVAEFCGETISGVKLMPCMIQRL